MPYLSGGDLRFHLNNRKRMDEEVCAFYAAEILLGLT
jgi:serine/threonine protein kinase